MSGGDGTGVGIGTGGTGRLRTGNGAGLLGVLVLGAALLAAGCARIPEVPIPGLYRIDVRQGNALEDAALARLEVGMPKSRVLHILGTPAIDDVFHADRWEYLYSFAPGGEESQWRRITLHFEDNRLARIEGDVPEAGAAPSEPEAAKVVRVPPRPPEKGLVRRAIGKLKRDR